MRFLLSAMAAILILGSAPAIAAEPPLVVKESIDSLAAALKAKDVEVMARIDHAAAARPPVWNCVLPKSSFSEIQSSEHH